MTRNIRYWRRRVAIIFAVCNRGGMATSRKEQSLRRRRFRMMAVVLVFACACSAMVGLIMAGLAPRGLR